MATMRGWRTLGRGRLSIGDLEVPEPSQGEILVGVEACGVCPTDLHVVDGDLPPHRIPVVPGHQVVGRVLARFDHDHGPSVGTRVGVPWLRSTCGRRRWCRAGAENLCEQSRYTGWDDDGGYAEYVVAPAAYTYRIPDSLEPLQAAPLLRAGIIGYRALRRSALPPGGRLGLYGFGASAHLTAQIAIRQGAEVHVVTRGGDARRLALELGVASAVEPGGAVPPLDSAIVFAPAGEVVREALADLGAAGTCAVAGIHVSEVPPLDYQRHLFRERTLTTVTSNTRADGAELFRLAGRLDIHAEVTPYAMRDADRALADLAEDRVRGVAVLDMTR